MSAQHTPGPWAWFGNQHGIYLATVNRGRQYVMGFERMGMNGAQPTFQIDHRMRPASELVTFEVGDQIARGFKEGKADESVYRLDVSAIDAPDAYLIAAAPELLEAAKMLASLDHGKNNGRSFPTQEQCDFAIAAIAKARGEA